MSFVNLLSLIVVFFGVYFTSQHYGTEVAWIVLAAFLIGKIFGLLQS